MVAFGWMLLHFGSKAGELFSPPEMTIHLQADRADGLAEGSAISYLGVTVGRVTTLTLDTSRQGVNMDGVINLVPGIPDNVIGHVRPQSYISSGASVSLETDGAPSTTLLKPDAIVKTEYVGNALFPKEFTDMAEQAREVLTQFRSSHVVEDLDVAIKTTNVQLIKAGNALDSVQKVTGDPEMQKNLIDAIASIRQSADTTKRITANLDNFTTNDLPQLSGQMKETLTSANTTFKTTNDSVSQVTRQLDDRLEQVNKLLDQTTQIATKVNNGQGTAGQLINDPKLYANLVETTGQLNDTIKDLKRLIDQWEQEGVNLKGVP
jgi:phospholipid/cholesterol/gamma-HCH transport system substrate-binding protein